MANFINPHNRETCEVCKNARHRRMEKVVKSGKKQSWRYLQTPEELARAAHERYSETK